MNLAGSWEDIQRETYDIRGNEPVLKELLKLLDAGKVATLKKGLTLTEAQMKELEEEAK